MGKRVACANQQPIDQKIIVLTPAELAKYLRVGRLTVYKMLREGTIKSIQVGHQKRVTVEVLEAFVGYPISQDALRALGSRQKRQKILNGT